MKKINILLIILFVVVISSSCDKTEKEITCEEVIKVYEEAGYTVFHKESDYKENQVCYVKCTAPNSEEYIFFNFFETSDAAKKYADERDWNVVLYIFSCALCEPTWLTTKTYNNIEIEYHKSYLYKPFKNLI